ncbi:MAG: DUF3828 domain-containing protein [Rhodoblastus sp.]|nr:MAG: DUF3828 domain-containing protein [Rhodoblastus sp.]
MRVGLLVVGLSLLTAPFGYAAGGAADAVRALYGEYQAAEKTRGMGPDQLKKSYYTPRVRREIVRLHAACRGKDVCLPDADFLIDGQDFKIDNLNVVTRAETGDSATVEATFTNFDSKVKRVFKMKLIEGRWLIDDIDFGGGRRLKDELKPIP